MMNSSYDDEFAPNPFRGGGAQQQPPLQHQQQPPLQQQQQQQQPMYNNNQGGMMMTGTPMQQPDPYSGMTGPMDIPDSPPLHHGGGLAPQQHPMHQQQPMPPPHDPTQWSGAMDQRAPTVESYGQAAAGGPNDPNRNAAGGSMFSRLFGWNSCVTCFQLESYIAYFDLETKDVVDRLKASLLQFWWPDHFRTALVGDAPTETLKGPDLYGPVWISFTLIFLLAATSNVYAYWKNKHLQRHADDETELEEFEVDIHLLLHASTAVFFFVFGVSTLFWLATNCMGMPNISWGLWVCCYGYCQVPFLPASVVIALLGPWGIIAWIILGAAAAASALLILRNLSTPLMAQDTSAGNGKAGPLILAILGAHVMYFAAIKIMFFW